MKGKLLAICLAAFFLTACGTAEESVVVLDGPILQTEGTGGSVNFNGAVLNTADFPVHYVYVIIFIKDANENVIAVNSTQVEDGDIIEPSESSFFTVGFDGLPQESHSKEVQIYYDLAQDQLN